MEGAVETTQLFAFPMQRQVESITNMSEMAAISSGPAGKAKNYFAFCFLKKLHCISCGLCPSFFQQGQLLANSIQEQCLVYNGPADKEGQQNAPSQAIRKSHMRRHSRQKLPVQPRWHI